MICIDCGRSMTKGAFSNLVWANGEWREGYLCPTCLEAYGHGDFLQKIGDAKVDVVKPFHERVVKKGVT